MYINNRCKIYIYIYMKYNIVVFVCVFILRKNKCIFKKFIYNIYINFEILRKNYLFFYVFIYFNSSVISVMTPLKTFRIWTTDCDLNPIWPLLMCWMVYIYWTVSHYILTPQSHWLISDLFSFRLCVSWAVAELRDPSWWGERAET